MTFDYTFPRYDGSGLADVVTVTLDPLYVALSNPPRAMVELAACRTAFRHYTDNVRPLSVLPHDSEGRK